jgi:hypothetical protein
MSLPPCKFSFEGTPIFDGYALGSEWNGFDNVAVTPATARQIADYFRSPGDADTATISRPFHRMRTVSSVSPEGMRLGLRTSLIAHTFVDRRGATLQSGGEMVELSSTRRCLNVRSSK